MARRRSGGLWFSSALSLGLAVMAVTWAASTAQLPQQPPQPAVPSPGVSVPSCPPVQASLLPCVSYFIGNSSSPSDACCAQMRAMFQSQAPCLCAAVSAVPAQLGSVVGSLLPTAACNLPPNACSAVTGTSGSAPEGGAAAPSSSATPTDAAAAAPVTGPADANPAGTPSGGGVKSVPGMVDSAAVAAECKGTSAAVVVLAMAASFLAAYVL